MTDPRPRPSRGRGRGKHSDRVIESGEREACSYDRKQEIPTEGEDGRWHYDRWTDNDKRFDGGGNTNSAVVNDGGKWKHDRWMDSDASLVEKEDNKSASPRGRARRTDVIGGSSGDGGKRDEACGEQKESISSRPTRNRPKRPEVQRYVPRGRRLQEEAEKRASKSREDNSAKLNTQKSVTISKGDKSSQLEVELTCVSAKRTKDDLSQINAEKRMAIAKVENFAQINMDETVTNSKENNSVQPVIEKTSGRNPGKNSPQLNAGRRVRKSTEDNSLKQCKEDWIQMSEGRPDNDSVEFNSKSSGHIDAKPNRGSQRKRQTRGNVYVPPGRWKVTSEGGENSNKEVIEMTGGCYLNVSDDRGKGEKMHEGIDRAESKPQESAGVEEECSDRHVDAMECSQRQNYGANDKSQELQESQDLQEYHHSSEINKNKIEQVSSESGVLLSEGNYETGVLVSEGSIGCTESQIKEIGHIKVEEKVQEHKPEESEKSHSRKDQTEDICKEDFEEYIGSMNKKMKVECSNAPICLEHSKNDENLDDAVNTISCSEMSAIVDKDNSSLTSDKKENENLDTSVSKTEEAQTASTESGNEDDVEIGSYRHSEENSTGNECANTEIMETNDTMETTDIGKTTGSDDQKISNEKQPESNEVHDEENRSTDQKMICAESDTVNEKQTDEALDEKSNDIEDEEEEDSWDRMFDDEGECLDPSAVEELTKKVGKVKIKKAKINYLDFKPKDPDLDYDEMGHVIEIFGFPAEFKTEDLLSIFQPYKDKGFDIKWVDDTHALGVFSSPIAAQSALGLVHPLCKVGPLTDATRASKVKAKRSVEFLQPYKPRPETSAAAARRLVSGALGLSTRVSKEQREKERQKLREAKEKRKMERKQKDDIWEGTCTSSTGHDNR